MSTRDRLLATLIIWAAWMITLVVLFEGQVPGSVSALTLITLALILCWAAVLGTLAVWRHADPCEKFKRAQRVARLAENSDDSHERDTLIAARSTLPEHRSQHDEE
jgi:type VI protein secretion system component VasK